jgi:hypothetical protein
MLTKCLACNLSLPFAIANPAPIIAAQGICPAKEVRLRIINKYRLKSPSNAKPKFSNTSNPIPTAAPISKPFKM